MTVSRTFRTSDLAKAAQVGVQQVRNYEAGGLIPPAERAANGYRQYTRQHLVALTTAQLGWAMPREADHRLFDPAQGGGALLDLGVYSIWWSQFVLGTPAAVETSGVLAHEQLDPVRAGRRGPAERPVGGNHDTRRSPGEGLATGFTRPLPDPHGSGTTRPRPRGAR